jgi:hypothetical protein
MRLRGLAFLALALPLWGYVIWFIKTVLESPYGYELGSVAMPFPVELQIAELFALGFAVLGIFLLVADGIRWLKDRSAQRNH